jgi:lipopolysaccharide transport system ATP-binding protein
MNEHMPTIFHVTHWKAGSQWIKKILKDVAPTRYVDSKVGISHFLHDPIRVSGVYPTVYITKEQFEAVDLPQNWQRFIIIRDLRDTLISAYFSIKVSHPILTAYNQKLRDDLISKSLEDGLIYLAEGWLAASANIQRSWARSGEDVIHYEDLLLNDIAILVDVLMNKCKLPVEEDVLRQIILSSRFKSLTGGRKSGEEDITAHERKGISGDWKNYFTDKISDRFKVLYGDLLIDSGYEKDLNW